MKKARLSVESLCVESFATAPSSFTDADRPGGGCVCDMAPCGCTAGPDCTEADTA